MEFAGIPFSLEEEKILECQYGKHYYKEKCNGKKRLRLQGTKKIGCPATIKIKIFSLYPKFKINADMKEGKTLRQVQALQKLQVQSLREALLKDNSNVQICTKFWVSIPSRTVHSGHPVGKEAVYCQRIHPLLIAKITEMVTAVHLKLKSH